MKFWLISRRSGGKSLPSAILPPAFKKTAICSLRHACTPCLPVAIFKVFLGEGSYLKPQVLIQIHFGISPLYRFYHNQSFIHSVRVLTWKRSLFIIPRYPLPSCSGWNFFGTFFSQGIRLTPLCHFKPSFLEPHSLRSQNILLQGFKL